MSSGDSRNTRDRRGRDAPRKFFYGWVIVIVMASAGAASMAMGSLNFGLFIKPMGDQLMIGRAWFGWAQTARQVASSVTSPAVGVLIDRYGSRAMLPVAAIVTGLAMAALAFMTDAWHLVALYAVMGLHKYTSFHGVWLHFRRARVSQSAFGAPLWVLTISTER